MLDVITAFPAPDDDLLPVPLAAGVPVTAVAAGMTVFVGADTPLSEAAYAKGAPALES